MSEKFTLKPADVPPVVRKGGTYHAMLDQFLTMKDKSVVIQYEKKASTVYISLKRIINKDKEKYGKVTVSQRKDNIYLIK